MPTKQHFFNVLSKHTTVRRSFSHHNQSVTQNIFLGPTNVFWVIGDAVENQLVINHHLTVNQYKGDQLRRVFPRSPYDFSVELTVNRTIPERVYSCVIDGASDIETTIFTYIVRTISM